ncbi:MAG: bifunctional glutamate N-acetyltransferase/amino-acid acetyltransferase ArgJ [Proteobacteria bacterium]|nr:bifunctional glutamate N-acetyltransferase/amino-acid acetyltransferase ArgJ [Pseudomonadota bacterium]NOG60101.1 bifunctional glutamate N-acetyltransferase/amino-acid acetyltransferase ArgJ [Pseudomonadota bacterium]
MSVGLEFPSSLVPIKGVRLASTSANIYSNKRNDLLLIELDKGTVTSAVFTRNIFCAAPVKIAKENVNNFKPRYLLINSGNANAGTGEKGIIHAKSTCQSLATITGCKMSQILPFSTGVIGEDLPVEKINQSLPELVNKLSNDAWLEAAQAIMTTDTIPKAISRQVILNGVDINLTGIAKGAGMIKPNMATMLSFIATDANISKEALDIAIANAVNKSFNRITIDGDTSTNDACAIFATGKAKNNLIDNCNSDDFIEFERAVINICCDLAQAIVRDGEGATKFISIEVSKGKDQDECLGVAYKIAESPLVKTAFTASDPNWGRILAAIGNSGINDLNINNVSVYLDDVCIVDNGERSKTYTEESGKKVMVQEEIKLSVNLNRGACKEEIWTTDLSHEYITINAEYRT